VDLPVVHADEMVPDEVLGVEHEQPRDADAQRLFRPLVDERLHLRSREVRMREPYARRELARDGLFLALVKDLLRCAAVERELL